MKGPWDLDGSGSIASPTRHAVSEIHFSSICSPGMLNSSETLFDAKSQRDMELEIIFTCLMKEYASYFTGSHLDIRGWAFPHFCVFRSCLFVCSPGPAVMIAPASVS